ncbi:hypothetical protein GFY24_20085 [Nocardia sp. SYP-A9097]|uniref:hypothetical protein n=1 Tax=Nocardia sp. SYP-A9097 TaxID=2663237 RepID=UPI00129BFD1F|nr:hypothetical protein [Nocardia sp. SYP-A9097]MRH89716.1 hypothetical protein [Nocardia sp. SYP-A9097]
MGEILRADLDALRAMAAAVRVEAETIAGIDPADLIARVGLAMPNSVIGAAADEAGEPVVAALRELADRLTALSGVVERGVKSYEEVDAALGAQLDSYMHG